MTNHRKNGFFLSSKREGWEYVVGVALLAIALGALGPGRWSLDHAIGFSFPFQNGTALIITAALGLAGAAAFLAVFWRPPAEPTT